MLTDQRPSSKLPSTPQRWPTLVLSHLLPPLLFVALVLGIAPIGKPLEFDTDEGINLIKALLYGQGFSLYTEIWSDQPPLLTIALHHWFTLFGPSMLAGRILVLLFATLLIWAFYQTLRLLVGTIPACVGTILLISSKAFIQLSASVMVGLPCLALAMLSIYLVVRYHQVSHHRWLIPLSGGLLALSLHTKLFTVFLVPLVWVYGLDWSSLGRSLHSWRRQWPLAGAWVLSFAVVYLGVGLLSHAIHYDQLLQAHLNTGVENRYADKSSWNTLQWLFQSDRDFLVLALIGVGVIVQQRRWHGLFPCAWLATATLLLLNHRPVWYHHLPLLAIPLAWLAAYGVLPVVQMVQRLRRGPEPQAWTLAGLATWGVPALSALLVLYMANGLDNTWLATHRSLHKSQPHHHDLTVSHRLMADRDSIRWVLSDRPIYPFQAELPVPPEIAVFSEKRWVGGNLTPQDLRTILVDYKPERVILSRFREQIEADPAFMAYLHQHYSLLYRTESVSLYGPAIASNYTVRSASDRTTVVSPPTRPMSGSGPMSISIR